MTAHGKKDVVFDFASYIAKTKYEDIPKAAVDITKKSILDALGVAVAGSGLGQNVKECVEIVEEMGGKKESTIIGFGVKAPCFMAAFANGAISHTQDFDDVHDAGYVHPTVASVPPAFAMAERIGKVSGKDLITAVAIGNDLITRMAMSFARRPEGYKAIWMWTPLFGVFSATAVCCKLMNMSETKIVNAMGIALEQSGGSRVLAHGTGSTLRGLYANFPCRTGVFSALMADKGITTGEGVFEAKSGFYNLYLGGSYHRASLTDGLGKRFDGVGVSFKPWPSCRETHTYVEATLKIMKENGIKKEDITAIKAIVNETAQQTCLPLEGRRNPQTVMDAKYSIPFTVGIAATYGEIRVKHLTVEGLKDKAVLEMASKATPVLDNSLTIKDAMPPAIVEIKTRGGKVYSKRVDVAYGNPTNPISKEDLIKKFEDCLAFSVKKLSAQKKAKALSMLDKLEEVSDAGQIMSVLC